MSNYKWGKLMNKITAIYTRVSSNEQAAEGYGLDSQEEKCRAYASIVLGVKEEDIKLYVDDGYSAKDIKRPMLLNMMEEVREGMIERIIIYKLDRLSRSVVDTYALLKELMDLECGLISVIDQLDISTANGRLVIGVLSIIAQWEREVVSERMRAAREVMIAKGIYPYGMPPFGWKRGDDKKLEIDEKKAFLVNLMGDMLIEGMCLSEIRDKMKIDYGLSVSKDMVGKYLRQEANIGIFRRDDVAYTNIIPPIMSVKKYDKIQEYLKFREHHSPNKKAYIFHSLMYCKDCNVRMRNVSTVKTINKRTKHIYYYYACPQCGNRISQNKIKKPLLLSIFMEGESDRINYQINLLKKDMQKIKRKEESLLKDFVEESSESISQDIFKKLTKDLMSKKALINNELKFLKLRDPELLEEADTLVQYEIVHKLIKKIYIHEDTVINIVYKKKYIYCL